MVATIGPYGRDHRANSRGSYVAKSQCGHDHGSLLSSYSRYGHDPKPLFFNTLGVVMAMVVTIDFLLEHCFYNFLCGLDHAII